MVTLALAQPMNLPLRSIGYRREIIGNPVSGLIVGSVITSDPDSLASA